MSEAEGFSIAREAADIVMVLARRGRAAELAALLGAVLPGPGRSATGVMTVLWVQPEGWLVLARPAPEGALARRLKAACLDVAAVVDQTHGRVRLRLAGRRAAEVLAQTCRVDLHPMQFKVGDVAATEVAHVAVTLYRHDEGYDVIVPSTLASAVMEMLG